MILISVIVSTYSIARFTGTKRCCLLTLGAHDTNNSVPKKYSRLRPIVKRRRGAALRWRRPRWRRRKRRCGSSAWTTGRVPSWSTSTRPSGQGWRTRSQKAVHQQEDLSWGRSSGRHSHREQRARSLRGQFRADMATIKPPIPTLGPAADHLLRSRPPAGRQPQESLKAGSERSTSRSSASS